MTRDGEAAIEDLVAAAKSGDVEAFGRIFDHYHEAVHRYIAARVRRPSDAEDLAQLVFVKALEALPRYEQRGVPFGGWLFRLARNVVIDHIRTNREHVELDALVERTDGNAGPEAQALARQQMDEIAAALAGAHRRAARRDRPAVLRGAVGAGGRGGDGKAGRNGPGNPVPGDRGAAAPAGAGGRRRRLRRKGPRTMTNDIHDDWGDDGGLGPTLDAYADARLRADPERTSLVARAVSGGRAASRRLGRAAVASGPPVAAGSALPRLARGPRACRRRPPPARAGRGRSARGERSRWAPLRCPAVGRGGSAPRRAGGARRGPARPARRPARRGPPGRGERRRQRGGRLRSRSTAGPPRRPSAPPATTRLAASTSAVADRPPRGGPRGAHGPGRRSVPPRRSRPPWTEPRSASRRSSRVRRGPAPPGGPEATPRPTPKPKPAATPRPTPKPRPAATPRPTPKPTKTPPGKPDATPARDQTPPTPKP